MKITVIGASAGIGLEIVYRALDRNHKITALSRSEITIDHSNFQSISGSATNRTDLLDALEGADAVIVTLGTGTSTKATTLFSDFAKLLVDIQAEKALDIPFVLVTGFGAGESIHFVPEPVRQMMETVLKDVYADKSKMEEIIEGTEMNWIIVRPGLLLDGPLTQEYIIEDQLYKGIEVGEINRTDVADFLVKQAEEPKKTKTYYTIRSKR